MSADLFVDTGSGWSFFSSRFGYIKKSMAMTKAVKVDKIPEASIIHKNFGRIDYYDTFKIDKITDDTIDAIVSKIFMIPGWVKKLLKIRDSLVGIFGLRTGDNNLNIDSHYPIGSKAVYFQVLDRNDHEIVMAEDDVHLNFRTSVFVQKNGAFLTIFLTTIVKFNNLWGRLYFAVVKLFHRQIIKSILKRYLCGPDKKPGVNVDFLQYFIQRGDYLW